MGGDLTSSDSHFSAGCATLWQRNRCWQLFLIGGASLRAAADRPECEVIHASVPSDFTDPCPYNERMPARAQTLVNLKIWDGIADTYLAGADAIRIEGARIAAIGTADSLGQAGRLIDLAGLVAIPGLIDSHIHLCLDPLNTQAVAAAPQAAEVTLQSMAKRAAEMVASGITTARDLGGGEWLELKLRDQIKLGQVRGPRLLCAGQPITTARGHCYFWGGEASTEADIKSVIDRQIEHGVDLIKVMATGGTLTPGSDPSGAQFELRSLAAIVAQASQQGCQVAAHCHGTQGIRIAAEAGVATIEHCSWVGSEGWGTLFAADVAELMAAKGIWVSTTLNSGWRRFIGQPREQLLRDNYARMRSIGVGLLASTDAGIPNVQHHQLPQALPVFSHFTGLSPMETLKAATSAAARAIGLAGVTGTIEPGLDADLLFLQGDPLSNLDCLCHPIAILARGVPIVDFPNAKH